MRGYAMGAVDYVFKPVEPVVLRSKVNVFVDLFTMTQRDPAQGRAGAEAARRQSARQCRAAARSSRRCASPSSARRRSSSRCRSSSIWKGRRGAARAPVRRRQFRGGDRLPLRRGRGGSRPLGGSAPSRGPGAHADGARRARPQPARWRSNIAGAAPTASYKHFLDQAVLLPAADGGPARYAGTLLDVTDRKMLEKELLQARKMDAIGQLTGGIAHDFNNLLAAVLGGLDLIERRVPLEEEQRKILGMTRRAAEQGSELVRPAARLRPAPAARAVRDRHRPAVDRGHRSARPHFGRAGPARMALAGADLARLCRQRPARARLDEPDHQRPRRDAAGRRDPGRRPQRRAPRRATGSAFPPAIMSCSRSRTAAPASPPRYWSRSPSPSSPPRRSARAPGSASRWSTASPASRAARSTYAPRSIAARSSRSGCRARAPPRPAAPRRSRRAAAPPRRRRRPLRILLVDDHDAVRETTAGMLCDMGHAVEAAANGPDYARNARGRARRLRSHRHRLCDAAHVRQRHARSGPQDPRRPARHHHQRLCRQPHHGPASPAKSSSSPSPSPWTR